jgi:PAS domain S-box-containing protein
MTDRPIRVLLIDDDQDDYLLTRDLLADIPGGGFTLEWTADYDAGLKALQRGEHDIFLLDYRLGPRNGLDLLRTARDSGCPALVIMLTGQGDRELDFAAMRAGAVDYLVKGEIRAETLERAIRYALWQKRHADELEQRVRERTAELRASEERLRFALTAARMIAWEWDLTTGRCVRSANVTELLGIGPVSDDGADFLRLVHPDDRERVRASIDAARRGTAPYDLEFRLLTPDGRTVWVADKASVRRGPEGAVTHLAGICVDITERKRGEELINRFKAMSDWANDIYFVADAQARFAYVNRRACEQLGYTEQELLRLSVPDIDAVFDLPRFHRLAEELARSGRVPPFESVLRRKDGSTFPVELNVTLMEFSGRPYLFGVGRDITERKRVEETLRDSERRYAMLAELVPQLVWTTDADGAVDYFNQRWYDYTGTTSAEALGHGWAQFLHPADREGTWRRWQESLRAAQPIEMQYRLRGADGEYQWFLARGIPLKDDQGKVVKWFGTCTNIEGQKRAEEALRDADRRKDEFLATLAHELRNPLAPILNAVHILRLHGDDNPEHRWATDVMNRQVQQLSRLVDDLLDVSRISRGRIELRKERVDLQTVVARAVETSRPVIEARGHRLQVQLPPEPVPLEGDVVRLAQVLWNLLNNAAKYTEEGGRIWLTAKVVRRHTERGTRNGAPSVARNGGPDFVEIRVRDSGIGIPREMLGKVFDLFTQVERTLDRSQGGLGIGLTLVKRLTEMHGGTVEAHSDGPGLGSEFVVRLPLAPARPLLPRAGSDGEPAGQPAPQGRRVLIVDDSRDSARSLATLLTLLGNEVRTAHDGRQALEVATAYCPEVVLLDIGLPGMSGYDVARALRARPELGRPVLVAVTGYGSEEDRRLAEEAGFDRHLVKPVDLDALQQLLTVACP